MKREDTLHVRLVNLFLFVVCHYMYVTKISCSKCITGCIYRQETGYIPAWRFLYSTSCLLQSGEMPVELMELIILKSLVQLHRRVFGIRLLPRGDLLTMKTLMSVCQQWRYIVSTQRNRRQLHVYFRHSVCVARRFDSVTNLFSDCLLSFSPLRFLGCWCCCAGGLVRSLCLSRACLSAAFYIVAKRWKIGLHCVQKSNWNVASTFRLAHFPTRLAHLKPTFQIGIVT